MSRKTSVRIIIEKHSVTFTFKPTFVYKNITGSDYILHRTKNARKLNLSNERLFVMKLKRATIYNTNVCAETASSKKLRSH